MAKKNLSERSRVDLTMMARYPWTLATAVRRGGGRMDNNSGEMVKAVAACQPGSATLRPNRNLLFI